MLSLEQGSKGREVDWIDTFPLLLAKTVSPGDCQSFALQAVFLSCVEK